MWHCWGLWHTLASLGGPLGISWDPKQLWQEERSGVILLGHVLQVPLPWYWRWNKSLIPLCRRCNMKEGKAITAGYHGRQAPSLCLYFTPPSPSPSSSSILISPYPSSGRFTPLILDCLSFLCLEKLTLDGQSALTEEIWVQWSSVASWVPLSNCNTYNSSRLSTQCLWICQSCTEEFICIQLFIKKTNTMWDSDRNHFLYSGWPYLPCIVFQSTVIQPFTATFPQPALYTCSRQFGGCLLLRQDQYNMTCLHIVTKSSSHRNYHRSKGKCQVTLIK